MNTVQEQRPELPQAIVIGYKKDAVGSLLGFQGLLALTLESDTAPTDNELQLLSMAAWNFTNRVENYLHIKRSEEDNG